MKTKQIRIVAALLLTLMLCGCAGKSTGEQPTLPEASDDRPYEVFQNGESVTASEDVFVPDYVYGEEVTCSFRESAWSNGALAAKQGNWLYYGVGKNDGWKSNRHMFGIVKLPVGGTEEDRVVLMTKEDLHMDFNIVCPHCGQDTTTYGYINRFYGTVGDWLYLCVDEHIMRLRTDGKVIESVLCLEPDDQTTNSFLMIRDNLVYYLSEEHRPVSATKTEDTWTIRVLEPESGEVRDVGTVPVSVEMAGWCGDNVVLLDYDSYDHCNAYVLGADNSLTFCENWSYTYGRKHFFGTFNIMPGVIGGEMIVGRKDFLGRINGMYRMDIEDVKSFAGKEYYLPKIGEFWSESGNLFELFDNSALSEFLIPGTEEYEKEGFGCLDWGCSVDGGFCFENGGLFYYSESEKTIHQINEDDGENLLWPGDGYLYYVCTVEQGSGYLDGVYRIHLDGTGWEDVSWMVAPIE